MSQPNTSEIAIFAGGCFWGMQHLIRKQPGVLATRVGYTGGDVDHATYQNHGSHAEAVEITFDNAQTRYRALLEYFFQIHDPTTQDRQGNDLGSSYRSEIFTTSESQKQIAQTLIDEMNASGIWPGTIATIISDATAFWEAEPVHQDYLLRNPHGYTCHFPRPEWVLPK
ncbi:MAG: peptide-methionine (S)-S-oxide reductase MsrA [Gammaproteobacteria bacterium]|nr:peptide-methionine (S)-S-oxide reductase MsrA [Gammaproteobacteria bacterium]